MTGLYRVSVQSAERDQPCGCASRLTHWEHATGRHPPKEGVATNGEHRGPVIGACVTMDGEGAHRWVFPVCTACAARQTGAMVLWARPRAPRGAACTG